MPKPLSGFDSDAPRRAERAAATVSLAAGGLFALLLVSLHLLEPEFDPTWRFVSEYALGRFGWLMTAAFVSLAVALLACSVSVLRHVRTVPGRLGLAVIALGAAGLLLAAAFPTDPINAPVEAQTFSGRMHVLGASLDYTPVGMLLATWGLTRSAGWRPVRRSLVVAATVPVLVTVAFIAALPHDGQFGPGVYAGLVGRLVLLSYLGWVTIVGRHVLRSVENDTKAARQLPLAASARLSPSQPAVDRDHGREHAGR